MLDKAPKGQVGYPIPELRSLVGQTVTIEAVDISSEHFAALTANATLIDAQGEKHTIELGEIMSIYDEGVCGYNLDEFFEPEVLAQMLRDTIADTTNGMDSEDRERLQEDLDSLGE